MFVNQNLMKVALLHSLPSLWPVLLVGLAIGTSSVTSATAQVHAIQSPPSAAQRQRLDAGESLNELITGLVLQQMPHQYVRDKDWGKQEERFDGIRLRREGWRIETKRKKKQVNHGTWRKYSAELLDPRRQFFVSVGNIHQTPDDRLGFDVDFKSPLKLFGRQSKWVSGVQLYSISAEGKADVRLRVQLKMDIDVDPNQWPPDLVFRPRATAATLHVDEFRIDRISKLGGEFAQQITRAVRDSLDDEIAEKEIELVEKINREFDKHAAKLRLSLVDAVKLKWAKTAMPYLPPAVRAAMQD